MLTRTSRGRDADAHEQLFVPGIVEGVESVAGGESLRCLMHTVQLRGRSEDHLSRYVIDQDDRATLDDDCEEWLPAVDGRHMTGHTCRQVAELAKQPGKLDVSQRQFVKRFEACLR